jgi:glycosyltransferase involved in cell wall biosynthesis
MGVHLPKGWQDSIANRAQFVLDSLGENSKREDNWFDLVAEVAKQENGLFFAWLTLTGCYPDKYEYQDFVTQTTIYGLSQAVKNTLSNRSKVAETAKNVVSVKLISPTYPQIVDVTHTYFAPYLTGIQRVVFGVTQGVQNISTFIWVGDSGIIKEVTFSKLTESEKVSAGLGWRIRLTHYLHSQVPKLDRTRIGSRVRIISLPAARSLKRRLVAKEVEVQISRLPNDTITNILIIDCKITLPEIPASLRQIYIYESIIENEIVPLEVILYDFIPFFHAWTVHPNNRGHLGSYIRLVLLATRIISISALVQEQAKLITQAFRLERSEWSSRKQDFAYLALPSGLRPSNPGEFLKQKNLVVMAGSLEPRKNHLQFFSALELLSKEGVLVKARILGSAGWENEHILERIHDLQMSGIDIERLGNLNDSEMRKLIAEAQVLVQISEAEGFGLPVAEALALGTKVIVSNIRPLNEWKDSRVLTVSIRDIEQLKVEISRILKNPESSGVISPERITWADWHQVLYSENPKL